MKKIRTLMRRTISIVGTIKFLTALPIVFFVSANAHAENPDAILSKESARDMFGLSRSAWVENVRQVKAAGMGDFAITPTGEYTLYLRPTPGAGMLMVTPWYEAPNMNTPWKLSVTVVADEEPVLNVYLSMSLDDVKNLIQISAGEMEPEYSVMGYMSRNSQSAPSIHFTIFRAGDFPSIDMLNKMGRVCPPVEGKQVCIRPSMIE